MEENYRVVLLDFTPEIEVPYACCIRDSIVKIENDLSKTIQNT